MHDDQRCSVGSRHDAVRVEAGLLHEVAAQLDRLDRTTVRQRSGRPQWHLVYVRSEGIGEVGSVAGHHCVVDERALGGGELVHRQPVPARRVIYEGRTGWPAGGEDEPRAGVVRQSHRDPAVLRWHHDLALAGRQVYSVDGAGAQRTHVGIGAAARGDSFGPPPVRQRNNVRESVGGRGQSHRGCQGQDHESCGDSTHHGLLVGSA